MVGFPSELAGIDFSPFDTIQSARSKGGFSWDVEDADPYWKGRGVTGKLDHDRLQAWEGFVFDVVPKRTVISYVDPIYTIPSTYRGGVLPGSWDGHGAITNLDDAFVPEFSGLEIGTILLPGDRLAINQAEASSYHVVTAPVEISSAVAQSVSVAPLVPVNVMGVGSIVSFLNPPVKLLIEPNSWSASRRARVRTIGSFSVVEAPVVN